MIIILNNTTGATTRINEGLYVALFGPVTCGPVCLYGYQCEIIVDNS